VRGLSFKSNEVQYIEDFWGTKSIETIAKNLNRTVSSVINKKQRLKLGAFLESGEYITVNQFFKAIGRETGSSYTLDKWIKIGFPVKSKKVLNNSFKVVYIDDFWKWAKKYRMRIDFSKFEKNALGLEPSWVDEQREADVKFAKYKVTPWTLEEDTKLKSLLKLYKYTYKDLSFALMRTEGAIKRRMVDLNIMERPMREPPHGIWTKHEIEIVISLYKKGYRSEVIKEYIDKSAQAINGKIERLIRDGVIKKWD